MGEEQENINWEEVASTYEHWQDGSNAMKEELLRVAQLSYDGGMANAEWAKDCRLDSIEEAYDEASFQREIDAQLQELVASMRERRKRNPFMQMGYGLTPEQLADRFARAYLTTTAPAAALGWLEGLDQLDERVQYLTDAVCQYEVKQWLLELGQQGYGALKGEDGGPDTTTENELEQEETTELAGRSKDAGDTPALVETPVEKNPKRKPGKPTRRELMGRVHGFPWINGPMNNAAWILHRFLLGEEMIDETEVTPADIKDLFSKGGPKAPIRLLKHPAKVIHMIRLLALDTLARADKGPPLEDFSVMEIKRFGYWLKPRFIGTFRNEHGEKYTEKQLANAANRFPYKSLEEKDWYSKLQDSVNRAKR